MFKFIKKYQEKRRRKRILKIIKDAKHYLIEGRSEFMCICFAEAYPKFYHGEGSLDMRIQKLIPEFNRETLGATTHKNYSIWWCGDKQGECRIAAFDKLIEIYEKED